MQSDAYNTREVVVRLLQKAIPSAIMIGIGNSNIRGQHALPSIIQEDTSSNRNATSQPTHDDLMHRMQQLTLQARRTHRTPAEDPSEEVADPQIPEPRRRSQEGTPLDNSHHQFIHPQLFQQQHPDARDKMRQHAAHPQSPGQHRLREDISGGLARQPVTYPTLPEQTNRDQGDDTRPQMAYPQLFGQQRRRQDGALVDGVRSPGTSPELPERHDQSQDHGILQQITYPKLPNRQHQDHSILHQIAHPKLPNQQHQDQEDASSNNFRQQIATQRPSGQDTRSKAAVGNRMQSISRQAQHDSPQVLGREQECKTPASPLIQGDLFCNIIRRDLADLLPRLFRHLEFESSVIDRLEEIDQRLSKPGSLDHASLRDLVHNLRIQMSHSSNDDWVSMQPLLRLLESRLDLYADASEHETSTLPNAAGTSQYSASATDASSRSSPSLSSTRGCIWMEQLDSDFSDVGETLEFNGPARKLSNHFEHLSSEQESWAKEPMTAAERNAGDEVS